MSSISTSSRTSKGRRVMAVATSVSRNTSSGNAVQINGPVANEIYNFNFKTLVVNCQEGWDTEMVPSRNKSALLSGCTAKTLKVPKLLKTSASSKVSAKFTAQLPKHASDRSVLQRQNLTLISSTSDSRHPVRATFSPNIANNFIADRIVHRLGLVVYNSSLSTKEVISDDIHLLPTNDYVDLACYAFERKDDFVVYRFYVVKHGRFNLLFSAGLVKS